MIRWIVEGVLGTAPYSEELHKVGKVIDVRELADKSGNDPKLLRRKVEEGVVELNAGHLVLVTCDFGISRSNAIAAGILAKWKSASLDWAVAETVARTQESSIKLDVIDAIRRAMFAAPDAAKATRVMITGASGFLGRNVVRQLSGRVEMYTPSRGDLALLGAATQIERHCREQGVGQILHLAHPRVYTNNEALGESLVALKNLIDVCRVLEIRLILPSGGVVFSGYRGDGVVVDPTTEPRPKGIYGETKYLQEALLRASLANEEIEATIVRIAPTYGPGGERPRLIRYFHQCLVENKRIVTHVYRDAMPSRLDLLFIDDAVAGLEKVLNERATTIHHLAPELAYTPREIAELIAGLMNTKADFGEMFIDDFASNVLLNSRASRELLDWAPKIGIEDGISRTLQSFAN